MLFAIGDERMRTGKERVSRCATYTLIEGLVQGCVGRLSLVIYTWADIRQLSTLAAWAGCFVQSDEREG